MSEKKKILFIINPISGIGKKNSIPPLIEKHLTLDKFMVDIRNTERRGHAHEIALEEKSNYDAIIAVGGDGSVNEVGSALIDSNCAMGIIPAGSGNGLARCLNIPLNHEKAVMQLADFNKRKIDTASVNGETFLATCGFGFDGHIAKKFDDYHKRGFLSYIKLVIKEFRTYQSPNFKIQVGDKNIEDDYLMCTVANADQFGNNFIVSPDSKIDDGKLELVMIKKYSMLNAPAVVRRFFKGTVNNTRYFSSETFSDSVKLEVGSSEEVVYHIDGEPKKGGPVFAIELRANSLYVI